MYADHQDDFIKAQTGNCDSALEEGLKSYTSRKAPRWSHAAVCDLILWSSSCWVAVASVYLSLPNGLPRFSSGLFKTGNLIHPKHYVSERVDIQLKICKQKCIPSDSPASVSICSLTLPLTLLCTPKANGGRKVGRIQFVIIFIPLFESWPPMKAEGCEWF